GIDDGDTDANRRADSGNGAYAVRARLSAEGAARDRLDPRAPRGGRAADAAFHEEAHRARHRKDAAQRNCECRAQGGRCREFAGCGSALCDGLFCERGAALEAHASGAARPRFPLSETDFAYYGASGGTFARRRKPCGRSGSGSGGFQGCEGRDPQGPEDNREARERSTKTTEQEEVGGKFGTENTSLRFSAGLHEELALALVCQA